MSSSRKAITEKRLEEMYRHNARAEYNTGYNRGTFNEFGERLWGGWRQRTMMSLAYAIAFRCLLRLDEVLHIQVQHIRWIDRTIGGVELTLSFRKTAQTGGKFTLITSVLAETNRYHRDRAVYLVFRSRQALDRRAYSTR